MLFDLMVFHQAINNRMRLCGNVSCCLPHAKVLCLYLVAHFNITQEQRTVCSDTVSEFHLISSHHNGQST